MKHLAISPEEAADRLAIRELVEAYAHCADRRAAIGQMALFTEDTHFVVFMNAKDPKPSMELHSREALAQIRTFGKAFKRVKGCSPRQYRRGLNPDSPPHTEAEAPAPTLTLLKALPKVRI